MVLSSNWFSRYNSYLRTVFLRQFSISDLYKILMFPVILRKFFFLLIFDNLRTLFQLRKFCKLFFWSQFYVSFFLSLSRFNFV